MFISIVAVVSVVVVVVVVVEAVVDARPEEQTAKLYRAPSVHIAAKVTAHPRCT